VTFFSTRQTRHLKALAARWRRRTGVVQAPITAFVIVTEMTDNHAMMVPLMATALIASSSSRLICAEGIHHALAKNFVRQARSTARGQPEQPPG
jgi:H+/Cl- antiporter ClcA